MYITIYINSYCHLLLFISKYYFLAQEKLSCEDLFNKAMVALSKDEHTLPQLLKVFPLMMKGIGIHHRGLLPIIREITERMFEQGLIKVLFATETFSLGMNMPVKTVLFTGMKKFDGFKFRWVSNKFS